MKSTPDKDQYESIPIQECTKRAKELMKNGATVFVKFTCGYCGSRQTFGEPNIFYIEGICEECGKITKITHCGLMAMFVHNQKGNWHGI